MLRPRPMPDAARCDAMLRIARAARAMPMMPRHRDMHRWLASKLAGEDARDARTASVPHPSIEIGIPIEIWIYLDLIMWLI